jgi:hypothetical protein
MKREDFIFTIGYQGNTAIIDGNAKKKYGTFSWRQLAEKGLYKAAYCAVLQDNNPADLEEFISLFNAHAAGRLYSRDDVSRLFGVYAVPQGITRTRIID